jgi:methionyl-tRNA formyltransferase
MMEDGTMGMKIAFFCGHKSPYGIAHLLPLINNFDVRVVVIATDEQWEIFHQKLSGKTYYEPRDLASAKSFAKKILPAWFIKLFKGDYRKFDSYRKILRLKHIELWEIFDVNNEYAINKFKELDVDLFVSAAYPQIFSKAILDIPNKGAVNFHPALLPKYRGAHPHFWQIVNGEKEGGLTAHFMTDNIDDGDVIAQIPFQIENLTYSELYKKIILHTPQLVLDVRNFLVNQTIQAKPQVAKDATTYRNDREIHCRIFWNIHTSQEIFNLIRTGRAFCFFRGQRVVFDSSFATETNRNLTNGVRVESGTIVDIGKDSIVVKSIDGCINIKKIKKDFESVSFLRWAKSKNIYIGEKFE